MPEYRTTRYFIEERESPVSTWFLHARKDTPLWSSAVLCRGRNFDDLRDHLTRGFDVVADTAADRVMARLARDGIAVRVVAAAHSRTDLAGHIAASSADRVSSPR